MRIGGIYKISNFPDWEVLVTTWDEESIKGDMLISGIIFENKKFYSFCTLQYSRLGEMNEISNVYDPDTNIILEIK